RGRDAEHGSRRCRRSRALVRGEPAEPLHDCRMTRHRVESGDQGLFRGNPVPPDLWCQRAPSHVPPVPRREHDDGDRSIVTPLRAPSGFGARPRPRRLLPRHVEETLVRPHDMTMRHARAVILLALVAIVAPAPALAAGGSGPATPPGGAGYATAKPAYIASSGVVSGVEFKALINSGETAFGTTFEGIPDGIGVVPGPRPLGYIDLYVNHEQSRVPFGGFADFNDSSVSKVRLDLATKTIRDLDVAISSDEGFIRFCSNFMAGPEQGFPVYTLFTNEESNDPLDVPDGA